MNINPNSMTKVQDVQKRKSTTPDLKYSDQTERWTMNEAVQDSLNLDDSHGLNMYIGEDEDTGEQVVLVEIVEADDAEFFRGNGNVFIARRLADAIDHHSFALNPVDNMDGEFFVLDEWEGTSYILENNMINSDNSSDNPIDEMENTNEEVTNLSDDGDEPTFDYDMEEEDEGEEVLA